MLDEMFPKPLILFAYPFGQGLKTGWTLHRIETNQSDVLLLV